jgi:hypothetical protein
VSALDAERILRCRCCGGLCNAHREDPEADEPPGCWGCCGSGCRSCGNTGRWTLDQAESDATRAVLRADANIKAAMGNKEAALNRLAQLYTLRKAEGERPAASAAEDRE